MTEQSDEAMDTVLVVQRKIKVNPGHPGNLIAILSALLETLERMKATKGTTLSATEETAEVRRIAEHGAAALANWLRVD